MRLLYAIIFALFLTGVFYKTYKNTKDLLSPICLFCFLEALRYLPRMANCDYDMYTELNVGNVTLTFIFELIFIICVYFGYRISIKPGEGKSCVSSEKITTYNSNLKYVAYGCITLGGIANFMFIRQNGGLGTILLKARGLYFTGNSYYSLFSFFAVVGIVILVSLNQKKSIPIIIIGLVLYVFPYIIMLRRSLVLEPLLYIIFAYHFCVNKIRIRDLLKPWIIAIAVILMIFIVVAPIARTQGQISSFGDSMLNSINGVGDTINSFFEEFSYLGKDTFVYSHYNLHNFYYGRTALNALAAPIPRGLYANKPLVDDGVYLYNFMRGYYVLPPSNNYPFFNSIPFSNQGSLYANFGIIGLFIGGFLMGQLYKKLYYSLKENPRDPYVVICYFVCIYKLKISSIGIVQSLVAIAVTFFVLRIFAHRRVISSNSADVIGE